MALIWQNSTHKYHNAWKKKEKVHRVRLALVEATTPTNKTTRR
jgi:hypothetical protein